MYMQINTGLQGLFAPWLYNFKSFVMGVWWITANVLCEQHQTGMTLLVLNKNQNIISGEDESLKRRKICEHGGGVALATPCVHELFKLA